MRYSQITVALLLAAMYPLKQSPAFADQTYGSYAAEGQCFCLDELSPLVSSRIVPTPIGGQSVAQVCKRIGKGPGLEKSDGIYNYPVYTDPQCGNGPFLESASALDKDCSGTLDGTFGTCQGVGPRWDLKQVFSNQSALAAANPVEVNGGTQADQNVVTTTQVGDRRSGTSETLKATVIRSPSVAGRELPATLKDDNGKDRDAESDSGIAKDFAGHQVFIEGQRYLQARTGLPATGGIAGSRIILDGLVFLKDDGLIDPADLFQKPVIPAKNKSESKLATLVPETGDSGNSTSNPERRLAARRKADLEQAARESRDLAAMLQERQARKDRLVTENVISDTTVNNRDDAAVVKPSARLPGQDSRATLLMETRARQEAQETQAQAQAEAQAVDESEIAQGQAMTDDQLIAPEESGMANAAAAEPTLAGALGLPKEVRSTFPNFKYLEASPASFDVGGDGILLEGSAHSHSHIQYLGRVAITETYSNILFGAGYFLTLPSSTRTTLALLAGLEYGRFELSDDVRAPGESFDLTDTGLHVSAEARFVVNRKFELQGGLGYSSFFEGDPHIFGGGYYHLTPRLDILSRLKIGDNDLLGIGIRYYY